jgi:hypothetical protein
MPIYLRIMKNRCYPLLIIIFLVLVSVAYALGGYIENTPYKDADALRDTLKAKGLSDAEVDQAFLKYVNAGYNLKDVKVAMEAKYAIESLSDAEKIAYFQEHFSSSVSHLKNDYRFADVDILKLADEGVPLSSLYGKLTRISEDAGMGKDIARWTADAVRTGVVQADEVSLFKSAEIISGLKKATGTNPLSTNAGMDQILKIFNSPTSTFEAGDDIVDGLTVIKTGKNDVWHSITQKWTSGFGKKHIIFKHIQGNVNLYDTSLFPQGMTWEEVEQMIKVGLAKGARDPNNPTAIIFRPIDNGFNNGVEEMKIIDQGYGVTSAFPTSGSGVTWPFGGGP